MSISIQKNMSPGNQTSVSNGEASNNNEDIYLLDGGFASQLSCHVDKNIDGDVLWSARFLATDPDAVINTHLDFLRAGAQFIQTNTYQASIEGFMEHLNLTEEESMNLIKCSVSLAKSAVAKYLKEMEDGRMEEQTKFKNECPLIVGSVGPYGASLHDASEYTGSYAANTPVATMREWHRPRIAALVEAGVDMLALETIPCKAEAEMLVELIKDFPDVKAWLSFSCSQDGKTIAYGEDFQQTAKKCFDKNPKQLVAVGVNCLAPRLVEPLFKGINKGRENKPVPLIVYPNSGENYNVEQGWIDREKCEPVETYIHKWLDLGVKYIGGCCRTYANDVTRIGHEIKKWQHQKQTNGSQEQN